MWCTLCGCDVSIGEHGVFRLVDIVGDVSNFSFIICKPIVTCDNPRRLGVITGISGEEESHLQNKSVK